MFILQKHSQLTEQEEEKNRTLAATQMLSHSQYVYLLCVRHDCQLRGAENDGPKNVLFIWFDNDKTEAYSDTWRISTQTQHWQHAINPMLVLSLFEIPMVFKAFF